jgi:hypothetical protein
LVSPVNGTDTSISVDNASAFANAGTFQIDSEQIVYTSKFGNAFVNVRRGANGTRAAAHVSGALVIFLSAAVPTPTPRVHIEIGSGNGGLGEAVNITVSLHVSGASVAATSNSIIPDRLLAISMCQLNPALEVLGKSLVLSGVSGGVRLVVQSPHSASEIPDGPLYTCFVQIAESARQGRYILKNLDAEAFSPAGTPLSDVGGTDGFVTVSFVRPSCVGDCNGSGQVTVDELITGVNIALDILPVSDCPQFDSDGNGSVSVDELVKAVDRALNGCVAGNTR